jgi:hypothetical protein
VRIYRQLILVLALALAYVVTPLESVALRAQSLAAAEASAFLGAWALGLDTPQGAFTLNLTLKDEGGKVVGSLSADIMPAPQTVTDISKDGNNLVLKYTIDAQGQTVPAKIVLVPDGDKWKANFELLDGQIKMEGTATKK